MSRVGAITEIFNLSTIHLAFIFIESAYLGSSPLVFRCESKEPITS